MVPFEKESNRSAFVMEKPAARKVEPVGDVQRTLLRKKEMREEDSHWFPKLAMRLARDFIAGSLIFLVSTNFFIHLQISIEGKYPPPGLAPD